MTRVCACPLAEPMDGMPEDVKYRYADRCRQRAYRAKVKAAAEAAGRPAVLTLHDLDAGGSTGRRNGDAVRPATPARRRSPDLRVSYRKALAVLTEEFTPNAPEGYGIPQPVLAGALERALTPLQRAQVDKEETNDGR